MITEDYCSYELAVLLKEKGFDGLCRRYNFEDWEGRHTETSALLPSNFNKHDGNTSIPTHQMAMKWLREVYGVIITISPTMNILGQFNGYLISMDKLVDKALNFQDEFGLDGLSYEEAVEAALKYSLKNLI